MRLLLFLLIFINPINLFAQDSLEQERKFVFDSNLPDVLNDAFKKIESRYSIRTDLNPFYLRGDFDGDNVQDYALVIIERETNKSGILIYHNTTKLSYIIGAGHYLVNGYQRDDFDWMGAWKVYDEKDVGIGVGETEKLVLMGEAILAIKLESSSGLIYWTGKEYKWYQQGD